ncbi:hypothetical protein M8C21_024439, partial [Ambrosia artemisiifolia]
HQFKNDGIHSISSIRLSPQNDYSSKIQTTNRKSEMERIQVLLSTKGLKCWSTSNHVVDFLFHLPSYAEQSSSSRGKKQDKRGRGFASSPETERIGSAFQQAAHCKEPRTARAKLQLFTSQAISLEGNPAQKNVGDEQLKKFLLGLLPHLAYCNRQSIKSGAMKDSADRAAWLGISAHQIDLGIRSEAKKSTHGRKSQGVICRGWHVRLPPSGVNVTGNRHQFHDVSSKLAGSWHAKNSQ